eukprot:TRINITY_DN8449_c0_g1_i2.p1 TRINITY_DN8449_c0_g1~~TRINITY_DN8449_c0_g1_i2.p1  ORF type:complete len:502 (-),score=79.41 TRINITY_DN8449_c0_g1_i2:18-1469(-)
MSNPFAQQRQEVRISDFKRGFSVEDSRRKREQSALRIRKSRREQSLAKRRNIGLQPTMDSGMTTEIGEIGHINDIATLARMLGSAEHQLKATAKFRKMLSIETDPPIKQVIAAGVVPIFIRFLERADVPQLQFESAWALTNIASGSSKQTALVVDAGAVAHFVKLLQSPNDDVREQAIWALGNIAGDSTNTRDLVLNHGALAPLLTNIAHSTRPTMLRNAVWTLSNLCRGKPQPPLGHIQAALPTLAKLLHSKDDEVVTDALWALSYVSDGENDRIQAVLDAGIARRLMELLMQPSLQIKTPALRTVGNIVTGTDKQTAVLMELYCLPYLLTLLNSPKKAIKKEACWAMSNITAGCKTQIEMVINANIFPVIISLLANSEFDVKREAAWCLSNATSGGSKKHIKTLVELGCLEPLCDLLDAADARVITVALEALGNILQAGEACGNNTYADMVEECNGLDKIEHLQVHQNLSLIHISEPTRPY